jgi:hypothetical protein
LLPAMRRTSVLGAWLLQIGDAGRNQPTIAPLQDVLPGNHRSGPTTINAWEDAEFRRASGRPTAGKLIMAAL